MGTGDEVFLDEPWLLMRWDEGHGCVVSEWKGFATHDEFRGGLMKALEAMHRRKADRIVNDTRRLESVNDEDQHWLRQVWAPLAISGGLHRLAVVQGEHGLAKFAIDEMFRTRPKHPILDSRTFTTMDDAFKWITQEPSG